MDNTIKIDRNHYFFLSFCTNNMHRRLSVPSCHDALLYPHLSHHISLVRSHLQTRDNFFVTLITLCFLLAFLIFGANIAHFWIVFLIFWENTWFFLASLWFLNQGINIYHLSLSRAFSVRNSSALYRLFWVLDTIYANLSKCRAVFSTLYQIAWLFFASI